MQEHVGTLSIVASVKFDSAFRCINIPCRHSRSTMPSRHKQRHVSSILRPFLTFALAPPCFSNGAMGFGALDALWQQFHDD